MRKSNKHLPKTPGLYAILNIITLQSYVGAAQNVRKRKTVHFAKLKSNIHTNPQLQKDYDTYGEDNFKFILLKEFDTIEEANAAEKELLMNADPSSVYNLDYTGKPSKKVGLPKTPEHRAKMSEAAIRRWERERLARAI